jgi:hypothetical protein
MGNKHIVMSSLVIGGSASSYFPVLWSVFIDCGDEVLDSLVGVDHLILQKEENTQNAFSDLIHTESCILGLVNK